jgi:hypothetical protein
MHPNHRLARVFLAVIAPAAGLIFILALPPVTAKAAECTTDVPAYQISTDEANRLYDCIEAKMLDAYSLASDVPGVADYRDWRVLSTSPFVSATHGSLMINHIVNPVATELYTRWEGMEGMRLPEGSILVKESYLITSAGEIRVGPLSIMEKAAPGTVPETGDWIYTRVFADGRYQRTLGPDGDRLLFCNDCHAATLDFYDAMFFPPEERRIEID